MKWIDIKVKRPKEGEIVWAILEDEHSPVMAMREFISEEGGYAFTFEQQDSEQKILTEIIL